MAGIDLKGFDPWPSITAGGAIDAPSAVLGAAGGDWLGLGLKVLGSGLLGGSKTKQSGAAAASGGALNTSGWVFGKGNAEGGSLETNSSGFDSVPWWGWAVFTVVSIAIIKKAAK